MIENEIKTVSSYSFWVKIYIAGDLSVIKNTCRKYCMEVGLCVNVQPATYIYTGGEETGAIVELINYARFPNKLTADIVQKGFDLGNRLMNDCCQGSYSVVTPTGSYFFSRRGDIK